MYAGIFYKESTDPRTASMLLSQRLIHTRVYGQAIAIFTTVAVMGWAETMVSHFTTILAAAIPRLCPGPCPQPYPWPRLHPWLWLRHSRGAPNAIAGCESGYLRDHARCRRGRTAYQTAW